MVFSRFAACFWPIGFEDRKRVSPIAFLRRSTGSDSPQEFHFPRDKHLMAYLHLRFWSVFCVASRVEAKGSTPRSPAGAARGALDSAHAFIETDTNGTDLPDQPPLPDLVLGAQPRPAAAGQEGQHAGAGPAGARRADAAGARGRPDRREHPGDRLRRPRGVRHRRPDRHDGPARPDARDPRRAARTAASSPSSAAPGSASPRTGSTASSTSSSSARPRRPGPGSSKNGRAASTPAAYEQAEKTDMTKVPLPRYDLVPFREYAMGCVQTSRGCPFQCEFCDIIVIFGRQAADQDGPSRSSPRSRPSTGWARG